MNTAATMTAKDEAAEYITRTIVQMRAMDAVITSAICAADDIPEFDDQALEEDVQEALALLRDCRNFQAIALRKAQDAFRALRDGIRD